jgi:hypothetical protein
MASGLSRRASVRGEALRNVAGALRDRIIPVTPDRARPNAEREGRWPFPPR